MKKIFVSGADGFVGKNLCKELVASGYLVRAGLRRVQNQAHLQNWGISLERAVDIGDLGEPGKVIAPEDLAGCDAVVHLAARVHVMNDTSADPLAEFRRVNVQGTRVLAEASIAAGVQRFVFVSSIKVNGEATEAQAFSESSEPNPRDPYAISKQEAEDLLRIMAQNTGLEVTTVRPPLVYGPGVGGNFYRLLRHLYHRRPVLLALKENRRSLVSARNLANFLVKCVGDDSARNELFLVSDGRPFSTRELIDVLASGLSREPRILTIPTRFYMLGKLVPPVRKRLQRLSESLQIDSSKAMTLLGWRPPLCAEDGLLQTAGWYLSQTSHSAY